MCKLLLIVLLVLTLPSLQQAQVTDADPPVQPEGVEIGQASIQSIIESGLPTEQPEQVPSSPSSTPNAKSIQSFGETQQPRIDGQSQGWDFLGRPNSAIQGSPKWVVGTSDRSFWNRNRSYYFRSRFCSYCPKQGITLYLSSTAYVYMKVNGQWIPKVYVPNWWGYHTINIPASMLRCGCDNIIEFYCFSFNNPYPIAISYGFRQNCQNSMNCPNPALSYYNRNTCQCECYYPPYVCNWPLTYSRTQCGCVCAQQVCPRNQYWDQNNCRCRCYQQVCSRNQYFNQNTCRCQTQCYQQICQPGYYFNQWTCRCQQWVRDLNDFGIGASPDSVSNGFSPAPTNEDPDAPPIDTFIGGGIAPIAP